METQIQTTYTQADIERILREVRFEYQRVELPFGLATPGTDRSDVVDLVLPASLAGKTVLDVGCALGYFCFEAEARGAQRVVGVELKPQRFEQASLLKQIKGSQVEFLRQDVLQDPIVESFDYVLLLNVIHHVPEPVRLLRQLASITRERMIVEFPTLADPKFAATVGAKFAPESDALPLIGVSSLAGADQTFVFTPSAIQRILQDHSPLFRRVEIHPSPTEGRAIAVCSQY